MASNTVYIHYGDDTFRKMNPIKNRAWFTKPHGGLWASRVNDPHGWKDWCETEEFRLDALGSYFLFTLKPEARVLELSHEDQLENLPKLKPYNKNDTWSECILDFEKLAMEYDAVEVTNIGRLYYPLYRWDCNSILVMNPDIVIVSMHEKHAS